MDLNKSMTSNQINDEIFGVGKLKENQKLLIIQNLDKMARLWDAKQADRLKFFQEWRVKRLQKKDIIMGKKNDQLSKKIKTLESNQKLETEKMKNEFNKIYLPLKEFKEEAEKDKNESRDISINQEFEALLQENKILKEDLEKKQAAIDSFNTSNLDNENIISFSKQSLPNDTTDISLFRSTLLRLSKCVNNINDEGHKTAGHFLSIFKSYSEDLKETIHDNDLVKKVEGMVDVIFNEHKTYYKNKLDEKIQQYNSNLLSLKEELNKTNLYWEKTLETEREKYTKERKDLQSQFSKESKHCDSAF